MNKAYPRLSYFFDTYLHEQWGVSGETWAVTLEEFSLENSKIRESMVSEISDLLKIDDEQKLTDVITSLGYKLNGPVEANFRHMLEDIFAAANGSSSQSK